MKKLAPVTALIFLLLCSAQKTSAQYYFYDNNYYDNPVVYEMGASVGVMNCLTDLGGKKGIGKKFIKDLNFGNTQFAGGLFFNALYKNAVALRLEGTFGQVKAYDSILKSVKASTNGRYERNLSFRSNITEFSLLAEIHPLFIFKRYDENSTVPRCSPYLAAGIGFYSFNPQAKLLNRWVDLQPLSTEGQGFAEYPKRKPYSLHQVNIPVGVGAKYELSPMINLRAEILYRILSTDYLDDVSTSYVDPNLFANYFTGTKLTNALLLNDRQYELDPTHITGDGDQRGNSKNNDAYFTFNVKVSLVLGREKRSH
ncbi:hypothetical protein [Ferruginibacter sp. SUN106]|uniref:hypothetical protein n=1 Tax=Ferruginibacter sp. SUN106 TaxID=2978348 RepID=UPI003D360C13